MGFFSFHRLLHRPTPLRDIKTKQLSGSSHFQVHNIRGKRSISQTAVSFCCAHTHGECGSCCWIGRAAVAVAAAVNRRLMLLLLQPRMNIHHPSIHPPGASSTLFSLKKLSLFCPCKKREAELRKKCLFVCLSASLYFLVLSS